MTLFTVFQKMFKKPDIHCASFYTEQEANTWRDSLNKGFGSVCVPYYVKNSLDEHVDVSGIMICDYDQFDVGGLNILDFGRKYSGLNVRLRIEILPPEEDVKND